MNYNNKLLSLLSIYLNEKPDYFSKEEVLEIQKCGVDEKYALALLIASAFKLDIYEKKEDMTLFNDYILKMLIKENEDDYINNPYYKNIKLKDSKSLKWEIKKDTYKPFQLFVRDDMTKDFSGKILPRIGYFDKEYSYYSIYQNDRLWMSISPNEINTMKKDVDDAFGTVLTFGLGMGYYTYMCAIKENVKKVIVVEKDNEVIDLFKKEILPYFGIYKDKIEIINEDAFEFARKITDDIDYIFVDIWHDVSDGKAMYLKMKEIENQVSKKITWRYWIEKTIKLYL